MQAYQSLSSGLSKLCVWGEHFSLVCYASPAHIVGQGLLCHSVHLVLYFQGQLLGIFAAFSWLHPCPENQLRELGSGSQKEAWPFLESGHVGGQKSAPAWKAASGLAWGRTCQIQANSSENPRDLLCAKLERGTMALDQLGSRVYLFNTAQRPFDFFDTIWHVILLLTRGSDKSVLLQQACAQLQRQPHLVKILIEQWFGHQNKRKHKDGTHRIKVAEILEEWVRARCFC